MRFVGRTPSPARVPPGPAFSKLLPRPGRPAKAPDADQGVRPTDAGLTLMEVLIAVSLLSLLSVGMLIAMRVGLSATAKANARLIDDRRVAGTQRILEQEIAGFMPVKALCGGNPPAAKASILFFQGEPQSMRFVSTYSLQQAWRGLPQILEFMVLAREDGKGVRLVVNEHLYSGPAERRGFLHGAGALRSHPARIRLVRAGRQPGLLPLRLPGAGRASRADGAVGAELDTAAMAAGRARRDGAVPRRGRAPAAGYHHPAHPR